MQRGNLTTAGADADVATSLANGLRQLENDPKDHRAFFRVADCLLRMGEKAKLWDLCKRLPLHQGGGAYLPSAMIYAATNETQLKTVAPLFDCDKWLSNETLKVSLSFNEDLASELLAHRSLGTLSRDRSTIGSGRWINRLDQHHGSNTALLFGLLAQAIANYVRQRSQEITYEFVVRAPNKVRIEAWANILHGDGQELWHVHPDGWLSGVYYVTVPRVCTTVGSLRSGSIEFGAYPFFQECDRTPLAHRVIQPSPGRLLLFPSYLAHRTWPTGVDDKRICIAFDLLPQNSDTG